MKTMSSILVAVAIALLPLCSCEKHYAEGYDEETEKTNHEEETDYEWADSTVVAITLCGTTISVDPAVATVTGSSVTITKAGAYNISGTLDDGQIIVNTTDEEVVRLILDGADIHCSGSAPIFIKKASKTVIKLEEGTENSLVDGTSYTTDSEGEPSASLFSNSNLTLFGEGTLNIVGNYNDAISCDDGLLIKSGTYNIEAVDDGIRGKDYVIVDDGVFVVDAGGNGVKSDDDSSASSGYITITYATMTIISSGDCFTAETDLYIGDGTFNIRSGGGSGTSYGTVSTKGIKGVGSVTVKKGNYVINSSDDAIHSNGNVTIDDGDFSISTGDDGLHADAALTVNGGKIIISKSYEGVEGASIAINAGTIRVMSSDDGLNTAGGNDGSGTGGGQTRPGAGYQSAGNYNCTINGGYIYINATGDGIDINGSVTMTDGTLIISGPTSSGNGAIDFDGSFTVKGGTIVAAGNGGMEQGISTSSTQYAVYAFFNSYLSANTIVSLWSTDGEELITYANPKKFGFIIFVAPELKNGESYRLYYSGSSTGTVTDGIYIDGDYTPGTKFGECTVSSILTKFQ